MKNLTDQEIIDTYAALATLEIQLPYWDLIQNAPTDGREVIVFAPGFQDLAPLVCRASYHPSAGWCVCELREPTHYLAGKYVV